jgi:hypothetical protein
MNNFPCCKVYLAAGKKIEMKFIERDSWPYRRMGKNPNAAISRHIPIGMAGISFSGG